jgi:hypothetical protein
MLIMAKVLFARIGYMQYYKGPVDNERPIGGGEWNRNNIGSEACNFLDVNGYVYGYVQPPNTDDINLERIEPGSREREKIDNVLVIWFASHPVDKRQVVIGWYKDATIFRSPIDIHRDFRLRKEFLYNIKAKAKDTTLLPIDKRNFPVGHNNPKTKKGNPGQSNVFYLLEQNGKEKNGSQWISKVLEYIENYGMCIPLQNDELEEDMVTSEHHSVGQGFQSDPEMRSKIEKYAMDVCKAYYQKKGFEVKDVSDKKPYDLLIRKNGLKKHKKYVEVKGTTQTDVKSVILTKNEVNFNLNKNKMVLFVVHLIKMDENSHDILIIDPWDIDKERLKPISYMYEITEE